MEIRTARTLTLTATGEGIEGSNFLLGTTFTISGDVVSILDRVRNWGSVVHVQNATGLSDDDLATLVKLGILLTRGSAEADRERQFEEDWRWGHPAAAMHFSLRGRDFIPVEASERDQVARIKDCPSPALTRTNESDVVVSPLPEPDLAEGVLPLMARRRTVRESTERPMPLSLLSTILFAGLGFTGQTANEAGTLPLKMSPSGGARNPFEAFVYTRRIDDLVPGIHHYSATDHTLGLIKTNNLPAPSDIVGSQPWLNDAAVIIFLVAHLERTMWKYEDPNAYRVVLIEAGHIYQNMMLAATEAGWSACPSAAINHKMASRALALDDDLMLEPVYALALMDPPNGLK